MYHNFCSITAEVFSFPYHEMKSFRLRISTAKRQLQKKRRILAVETYCRNSARASLNDCVPNIEEYCKVHTIKNPLCKRYSTTTSVRHQKAEFYKVVQSVDMVDVPLKRYSIWIERNQFVLPIYALASTLPPVCIFRKLLLNFKHEGIKIDEIVSCLRNIGFVKLLCWK